MSFKPLSRDSDNNILLPTKSKRSQSALEYMMTYGWAILIIVIVAVILYSMGIFNPSSSITTTSIGFSPFTVSSTVCSPAGLSVAIIGGGLPDTAASATISKIYITSNTGTTALTKEYNLTPVAISPGKTATIIIPTVACTSANVKYSLSAKLQYGYSTQAGPVITNTTGTISGTSSSEAIVKYVPLTITSSTATSSPFQQMVIVNMNNYNSYASSNLQNIEFTYPNGTIIPSWRENGTTNTQTVVYWLKLGSFTTATVYMDFFSTSSNVLNPVNTGEAPQISSTYAEYDNGANVFTDYWNFNDNLNGFSAKYFAGSYIPTAVSGSPGYVELLDYVGSSGSYILSPNNISLGNYTIQAFWYYSGDADGFSVSLWGNPDTIYIGGGGSTPEMDGGLTYHYEFYSGSGTPPSGNPQEASVYSLTGNAAGTLITTAPNSGEGTYYVYSQIALNKTKSSGGEVAIYSKTFGSFQNIQPANLYSQTYQSSSSYSTSLSSSPILFSAGDGGAVSYQYIYWVIIRANPPNGFMPSVSFGSVA